MTIRHLRIFNEVAQSGKMSIAAAKFYVSQPTVSQAIKELEEHYGVLLFERLSKKLHITEKGRQLLSYSKQVVEQFDFLESKMFETTGYEKLKVGSTITVGSCLINDILNSYQELNNEVDVYSYVNNTHNIEEKLLNSELDIGLVEGRVKSSDLVSIPAVDDYLVLVCSANHSFAKKKSFTSKDLAGEKFVMREEGSGTRELFENYLDEQGVSINVSMVANCPTAMVRSVIDNQCLAVLSIRLVDEYVKSGSIVVIKNRDTTWNRSFSIVYHKNKFISKHMDEFINLVKKYKNSDIFNLILEQ
ncbi:LysR family transcriptional regulator [Lachnoclostridium phytofermentans]|uniref:Transcriptional regulator, MarR family n=1 Tax=Lachnoclostridium phytofermentans (strain ATCC 700394 / DSM 18823 / ISDg) TaxID=357809 RepID=A9KSC1_LACP7|nr:LysR family transcriptional regulator [Lachnoclostridium phytofermentans]ABX42153.1 transcriptional regulator, MarR family [Lachnoclostridium phytofermentans ISDg]